MAEEERKQFCHNPLCRFFALPDSVREIKVEDKSGAWQRNGPVKRNKMIEARKESAPALFLCDICANASRLVTDETIAIGSA